jgi:hypothetical protein
VALQMQNVTALLQENFPTASCMLPTAMCSEAREQSHLASGDTPSEPSWGSESLGLWSRRLRDWTWPWFQSLTSLLFNAKLPGIDD